MLIKTYLVKPHCVSRWTIYIFEDTWSRNGECGDKDVDCMIRGLDSGEEQEIFLFSKATRPVPMTPLSPQLSIQWVLVALFPWQLGHDADYIPSWHATEKLHLYCETRILPIDVQAPLFLKQSNVRNKQVVHNALPVKKKKTSVSLLRNATRISWL